MRVAKMARIWNLLSFLIIIDVSLGNLLPAILWDPRNPLFSCDDPQISVAIGDKLNFVCPTQGVNYENIADLPRTDELFESAYLLQPADESNFNNCNASSGKKVILCDGTKELDFNSVVFKEMSGSATALIFSPGKTYYLIGTAFRRKENINNKIGGSCSQTDRAGPYKLRLKVRVCSNEETNVYKNCTRCSTTSCYYKGCTTCSSWHQAPSSQVMQNGEECYLYQQRNCTNTKLDVKFIEERKKTTVCPTTQAPTFKPTTKSQSTPEITSAPNTGRRSDDDEDSNTNLYTVGIVSGLLCLFIGLLLGILVHRFCIPHAPTRSNRFRESGKVTVTSMGIMNDAYGDGGTLVRDSPDASSLKKIPLTLDWGSTAVDGPVKATKEPNGVVKATHDVKVPIENNSTDPTGHDENSNIGKDKSISQDQQL